MDKVTDYVIQMYSEEDKYRRSKTDFNLITSVVVLLILGLMFLIVPWARNKELASSIIISKTFCFIYFLTTILIVLVFNAFCSNKRTPELKLSKTDIVLFLGIIYILINRYLIQEFHSYSIRFIELLGLTVLYIILRFLTKKQFVWLMLIVLLAGITQSIYGLLQAIAYSPSLHPDFKITGNFVNPGPFSGFLAVVWILALGLYLFKNQISGLVIPNRNGYRPKILNKFLKRCFSTIPLLGIGVILVVLPAARGRASWLAVIIGSILLFFFRYHSLVFLWIKKFNSLDFYKKCILFFSILGIIVLGLFGIYKFKEDSANGRLLIWEVSADIVKEYPVYGVGYDRFKAHYMNAQANYFNERLDHSKAMLADNTYYALNQPLQFTVENGFIGLLFLCVLGYLYVDLKTSTKNKYLKHFCLTFIFTYLIFSFFSFPSYVLPIKMVVVLILALLAVIDSHKTRIQISGTLLSGKKNYIMKCSVVFLTSIIVYGALHKTTVLKKGYLGWQAALVAYNNGYYKNSLEKYKQVYPIFRRDGDFLMNYGKALALDGRYLHTKDIMEQSQKHLNTTVIETTLGDVYKNLKMYPDAERAYQKAAHMVPNRFYPLYLLVKLYMESGQIEKARLKAIAILEKEVKIPSKAVEEIKAEMKIITGQMGKQKKENPLGTTLNIH